MVYFLADARGGVFRLVEVSRAAGAAPECSGYGAQWGLVVANGPRRGVIRRLGKIHVERSGRYSCIPEVNLS